MYSYTTSTLSGSNTAKNWLATSRGALERG